MSENVVLSRPHKTNKSLIPYDTNGFYSKTFIMFIVAELNIFGFFVIWTKNDSSHQSMNWHVNLEVTFTREEKLGKIVFEKDYANL